MTFYAEPFKNHSSAPRAIQDSADRVHEYGEPWRGVLASETLCARGPSSSIEDDPSLLATGEPRPGRHLRPVKLQHLPRPITGPLRRPHRRRPQRLQARLHQPQRARVAVVRAQDSPSAAAP
jgi:hypothetical protein